MGQYAQLTHYMAWDSAFVTLKKEVRKKVDQSSNSPNKTIETHEIEYQDGSQRLCGFLAYDANVKGPRPAVIIAHTWEGRGATMLTQARRIAALGYVAFALDIYGDARVGANPEECQRLMEPFLDDRQLLQGRVLAALAVVKKLEQVDSANIAAIGYCFGGLCVLDLARSGADVAGVVSFHGLLIPADISLPSRITAKVLVLHGREDPMVPTEQVAAFEAEMTEKQADWQFHTYGHAMHGFTSPLANKPELGLQYDKNADRRSWRAMSDFLQEVLG